MTSFALIPAAGKSLRMGRPKLSLPLGEQTILERVLLALRAGGVDHALVVAGPHVPDLVPLARAAGADALLLERETPDMRATIEHGLARLEAQYHPAPRDPWLLVPGDHPLLNAGVVRHLLAVFQQDTSSSIIVPTSSGRRGHPLVLAWSHVEGLRNHPRDEGVNAYVRRHHESVREVDVADDAILVDVDTPADYAKLNP